MYRGRYRLDGATKISDVALNTTDKRIAQQNLDKIVQIKQLEAAGLIPSELKRNSAQASLLSHLKDYLADLTATGRDSEYVYIVEKKVQKLFKECGWTSLPEVTSDSFLRWRAKQRKAPKTLNEYLASVSALLNWMERHERIERNPLKHVQKVQVMGREVRVRRAFTDEEMGRLLQVAGKRKVVYLMAVYTGLRRGELTKLLRTDLNLEAAQPAITVRASTTKNHKQAVIALHSDVVAELRNVVAKLPAKETRLLAPLMPSMVIFKADLKLAGIQYIDAQGRRAAFHSLRHTLGTNLTRAGTFPRVAMEIMRHSDMKLTAKTYTDAGLLPTTDAITRLPSLHSSDQWTQIGTQNLFRKGQDQSTLVKKSSFAGASEAPENQEVSHALSGSVMTGREDEKGCRARTRTLLSFSVKEGQKLSCTNQLSLLLSRTAFPVVGGDSYNKISGDCDRQNTKPRSFIG